MRNTKLKEREHSDIHNLFSIYSPYYLIAKHAEEFLGKKISFHAKVFRGLISWILRYQTLSWRFFTHLSNIIPDINLVVPAQVFDKDHKKLLFFYDEHKNIYYLLKYINLAVPKLVYICSTILTK